ncbi:hypothetical protein CXB36_26965 [Pseudomonas syringae pv. syringae]|nr:hypothetical protein BKC06_001745 [Pseudomonas syringae pv. syringae]PHN17598.1 hypothetical protein AO256_24520 [Pseudomonas syringae]KWS12935.1 hypothetical protein AL063_14415 [Pseudomonas syringae pv. syringae]PHX31956.1 hypothetical protein AO278_03010 [Pseudomonas syringae pv. syringae]PHX47776.1 hypothetical protein AO393_20250 [Pseudomonas syringae pv. syringae]
MTRKCISHSQCFPDPLLKQVIAFLSFDTGMANDYKFTMLYDNIRLEKNYNHKNNSKSNNLMTSLNSQAIKACFSHEKLVFTHDRRQKAPKSLLKKT